MKRPPVPPRDHQPAGVARDGEVYRLAELQRRMGWGAHALRQARVAGLRLISFGREKFVLGSDVIQFFQRLGDRQAGNGDQGQGGQ